MTKVNSSIYGILLLLFIPTLSLATIFTSQNGGDWHNPNTWDQGISLPGPGDDVIIDGHTIFISSSNATVNSITITNTETALSQLEIKDNITVNIQGDLKLTAENSPQDIKLLIFEFAIVNVTGDMVMERTFDNIRSNSLAFFIFNDAQLTINGSFDFFYRNSGLENGVDIQANNNAKITVGEKSTFQQDGGNYLSALFFGDSDITFLDSFDIILNNGNTIEIDVSESADITINKSLTAKNLGGTDKIKVEPQLGGDITIIEDLNLIAGTNKVIEVNLLSTISNLSHIDVDGNILLDASSAGDIKVNIGFNSYLRLAGNLNRPNKFGALEMSNYARFYFDGTAPQTIPRNKHAGIVGDSLKFTNVAFENATGFLLDGNVLIEKDLTLTQGIIQTTPDSVLILEDGVNILGGSATSYIDGPLVKQGTHDGSTFLFPIGNNGMYAPLEIEAITSSTVEYTAKAIGCPPPLGVKNDPLKAINQSLYWEIERNDGLALGEVTFHWDDASTIGITDTSSLVIAYHEESTGWTTAGRKNASGDIGVSQGSITIGCPPPLGVKAFGFGTTDEQENAPLSVEMTNFKAYKSNDQSKVFLEWQTVSEENSNYFVVQKSYDGISFHEIARVQAAQNSTTIRNYSSVDNNPEKGNNYYRIQEISQDQFMSFSSLVNVFFNGQEDIPIIYPNPVQNQVRVFSKDLENDKFFIKVLDINGQCLYAGDQRAQDGQLMLSTATLNVKNPGIYFLSYEIGGEVKSLKFFKVNQ